MPENELHDKLFALLMDKDAITWQQLLRELVQSESMDPWNIDVSTITSRYVSMLHKLKEMDFHLSGKVVLAAAILLRLKSKQLLNEDFAELDNLMAQEVTEEAFYNELEQTALADEDWEMAPAQEEEQPLIPRTPQPRKRKVSIYDLISALHKALEVKERRSLRITPEVKVDIPEHTFDVTEFITQLHQTIKNWFVDKKQVFFSQLTKEQKTPQEKVRTFIALLHLAHIDHREIDLIQKEPFGEIEIKPCTQEDSIEQ